MIAVVFDIETGHIPQEAWTAPMMDRYKRLLAKNRKYYGDTKTNEEIKRLTVSFDPMLSFICCITVQSVDGKKINKPKSYSCYYNGERNMLQAFWADVKKMPDDVLWVSFCGKTFDIPFMTVRSLHHNVNVTNKHLLTQRSPFSHLPHFDMQSMFGRDWRLIDACALVNVPSPKNDIDGSKVAQLIKDQKLEEVVTYCEGDVLAGVKMYMKCRWSWGIFPYRGSKKKGAKNKGNWKTKGNTNQQQRRQPPPPQSEY
ncbi:MAG: hypothetical protein GY938_13040 [Ketobacter sp.]|nr:hypothetical protein [Ketobacter sp.]